VTCDPILNSTHNDHVYFDPNPIRHTGVEALHILFLFRKVSKHLALIFEINEINVKLLNNAVIVVAVK